MRYRSTTLDDRSMLEILESRRFCDATFGNAVDWNDVAYAADGTVHMAYYDSVGKNLRYATKAAGGDWGPSVLIDSAGDVGSYCSIAVASDGTVGISYYDATNSSLKYAKKVATWTLQEVDTVVSLYTSLAFQSNGTPLISYYDGTGDNLKLAHGLSGGTNWTNKYTIDSAGDVGRHTSLAINPTNGRWGIAYESTTNSRVKYAEQTSSSINTFSTAIVQTTTGGAAGISLAFKVTSVTEPGITFYDAGPANLRYAFRVSGTWTGLNVATTGATGLSSNLWYNPANDKANIVYFDKKSGSVVRATEGTTPNTFALTTLQTNGGRNVSAAFGNPTDSLTTNDTIVFTYNTLGGTSLSVDEVAI
ncbi:MAG: hypothetical protein WBD40_12600 [Tepidisphaeraceae bacterium]